MKNIKLDTAEQEIENEFEEYKPVSMEDKKRFDKIFRGSRKTGRLA
jgi:hypothetical protein